MRSIFLILLSVFASSVRADTCPTPDQVRDRKLSNEYEWTVKEGVTLDEILDVKKLYSVRIFDNGDYVSCHYTTDKWPIRLDAKPDKSKCRMQYDGNKWEVTESGQEVCKETDLEKCNFKIECSEK